MSSLENDFQKELNEMFDALGWMANNVEKLPMMHQFQFISELMTFYNKIKPLYVSGLMIVGDAGKDN